MKPPCSLRHTHTHTFIYICIHTYIVTNISHKNNIFFPVIQAPPKKIPKTIENMRVPDETMIDPSNEEVS